MTTFALNGSLCPHRLQASAGMSSQRWQVQKAGFRKHVIPARICAVAWDLCFLKPSIRALLLEPPRIDSMLTHLPT